ncbi:MAG: hypothetical protein EOM52_12885 [Clostridia bacterium]|nr:hypothetical protein [Clostridia bacterium]
MANYLIVSKQQTKLCLAIGACFDNRWTTLLQARPSSAQTQVPCQLAAMLYDPDRKLLFAGGGSDLHQDVTRPQMFVSASKGAAWRAVYNASQATFSMYGFQKLSDGSYMFIGDHGIIRSQDGATFYKDPRSFPDLGMSSLYVNGTLFVSQVGGTYIRSTDNLQTFKTIRMQDSRVHSLRSMTHSQGAIFFGVDYLAAKADHLHESRIYKSTDNGETFRNVFKANGFGTEEQSLFSLKGLGNGAILAGTGAAAGKEMKIYRSADNGETWAMVLDLTRLDPSLKIARSFQVAKNGTVYVALDCSYASEAGLFSDTPDENVNS